MAAEPLKVLETVLKDLEEEHNFTKSEKEKDELLHKEKIEANKNHAKRIAQIFKDCKDNLNIALKAWEKQKKLPILKFNSIGD